MMKRTLHSILRAAAAASLCLGLGASTLADSIVLKGVEIGSIKITNIKNGKIELLTPNGNITRDLADIERLDLTAYPNLAKADDAYKAKQYPQAADLLEGAVEGIREEFLKNFVEAKLVHFMDRAGRYEQAMKLYVKVLDRDKTPYIEALLPTNVPTEPAARAKMADWVAEQLAGTRDDVKKKLLTKAAGSLAEGAAKPMVNPDVSVFAPTAAPAQTDPVATLLKAGKHKEALELCQKELAKDSTISLSRLLVYQGQAHEALGQDTDALLSYMRVVIQFNQSPAFMDAVLAAGTLFKKNKQDAHADKLYKHAVQVASDPKHLEDLKKLGYERSAAPEPQRAPAPKKKAPAPAGKTPPAAKPKK